ncbi:MAG: SMP-30/gluconolactonase/LRE family protein [Fibrobacteria bacterium]
MSQNTCNSDIIKAMRIVWTVSVFAVGTAWPQHTVSLPVNFAAPDARVEAVLEGLAFSEGPAVDLAGNLYFSEDPDVMTGRIWKITPQGEKSVVKEPGRGSKGLEFDNLGRLNIAMKDSVLRLETDGKVTVLAAKSPSLDLRHINDLSIGSTGAMFFTNLEGNTVFFRSPEGVIKTKQFSSPNGVEWIEEKGILYLSAGSLQKCQVNNATGEIGACASFAGATDGLTTDVEGNVYRASWGDGRIFVHDSTGKQLGYIAIASKEVSGKSFSPGNRANASNCHFGGPNRKTLFITGDGGCYKVELKVAGRLRPGFPIGVRLPRMAGSPIRTGMRRGRSGGVLGTSGIYFLDTRFNPVTANGAVRGLPE